MRVHGLTHSAALVGSVVTTGESADRTNRSSDVCRPKEAYRRLVLVLEVWTSYLLTRSLSPPRTSEANELEERTCAGLC